MMTELPTTEADQLKIKMRKYVSAFAMAHHSSFKPHYKVGQTLGKTGEVSSGEDIWRNVSEHCLVSGIFANILADELGLSEEEKNRVVSAAILHDFDKKYEVTSLRRIRESGRVPTLQDIEAIKNISDEKLRRIGIPEDVITLTSANIPKTEDGPQTDSEKIIWYVDMMLSETTPVPIITRLEMVERGWDGQNYDPKRAAQTMDNINPYKERFNGRHLNEVGRDLAVRINQEFATRLGFSGDPNDVPIYLNQLFMEKVASS